MGETRAQEHEKVQPGVEGSLNTSEYEYGPTISPDGQFLYFTSHRDGIADVGRLRSPIFAPAALHFLRS